MPPRLSIITPSFNQAGFIERTLDSVLDQGYSDLEYIVVDGGSTDGSAEIIERYADRLAWWVSEPDGGQTEALNKGLQHATGEYVAYINSDDHYLPGAFAAAIDGLESTGAPWIAGGCLYVDEAGRSLGRWVPELPDRARHLWVVKPWGVPQAATFWRRDLFERFGDFREDMHYAFDTEYGLRLAYAGVLPRFVADDLAVRVVHPEAKSWDMDPFWREIHSFADMFADQLTAVETARLRWTQALQKAGWYRLRERAGSAKRRLRGETVQPSGIRLDRVN